METAKAKVLLIEDNREYANQVRFSFRKCSDVMELLIADSLSAADAIIASASPAIILCDYLLPDGNGLTILHNHIKEKAEAPRFVLLTNHGDEKIAVEALKAGATDYIVKSEVSVLSLPEVCRAILREQDQQRKARAAEEEKERLLVELQASKAALEAKNAELESSEARFRSVTQTAPDAIITTDADGVIVFFNHSAAGIFGYREGEVVGKKIEILIPERLLAAHRAGLRGGHQKVMERLAGRITELLGRRKDGSEFPAELSMSTWEGGEGLFFTAIVRDVTERKRLEEQLRHSLKMETVGRLAGGVAHDFNNKLAVIIGYAELMKLDYPDHPSLEEKLDEVIRAASHSRDITRQLLTFSRQQIVTPKPVNLNDSLRETEKTLSRLIGEDIQVSFHLAPELWDVLIDPTQFDQIMMNLALNARDAMPDGGKLLVSTANTPTDKGCCNLFDRPPGDYVRLMVSDSGHGMDPETRKHIFEPFFTTKGPGKGTGLGLATVYGIVTQNNGFISVFSKVGLGTTFEVFFPRRQQASETAPTHGAELPHASGKILVVEDDDAVRGTITIMLERLGYTVLSTDAAKKAIRLCEDPEVLFDLVLADVIMPEMNGKEMMDRIQALRPGAKVLYMSGYSSEFISPKGVTDGKVFLIQKPFSVKAIQRKIAEVLAS